MIMKKQRVSPTALMQASNGAVVQAVSKNKNAIGYIGLGYVDKSTKGLTVNKVTANAQTALSKQWPIARELYIFTNGAPAGSAKDFVTYLLDPGKGQKNVQEVGYVPLSK
jgi:phosphate transport system substrate-binding protein